MHPSMTNVKEMRVVSFSASNLSTVGLNLLDRTLVHHTYLPNNVVTHLQLSILRQRGGK